MVVSLNRAHKLGCVGLMMTLVAMLDEDLECFINSPTQEDKTRYFCAHRQFDDDRGKHRRLFRVFLGVRGDAAQNVDEAYDRR